MATEADVFEKPAAPAEPAAIYAEAIEAARAAVRGARHLENPRALDCGFAWVRVCPATSPFVRWCKKSGHGDKHWHSGWWFPSPGGDQHNGQSVAVYEAGAKAFSEVLQRHGLDAHWSSRLD